MALVNELASRLTLDNTDFLRGMGQAEARVSFMNKGMAGLGAVGGTVLAGGLVAGAAGALALGAGIVYSTKAAMNAQEVDAQLQAVLESTGGVAGVTAEEVEALATQMSLLTKFDDEAYKSASTMMLQFTNIGKEVFPEAIAASADLATRMGIDIPEAAKMVGKALGDPVEGIGRLNMAFRLFNDEELKVVTSMAEAGDVAGAQRMVLDALTKAIGGAAEAGGQTFAGKMAIMHTQLENIGELIGAQVLPVLMDLAESFSRWLADPAVQAGIQALALRVAEFVKTVATWIPQVIDWFQAVAAWFQQHPGVIIAILVALGAAVAAFVYTTVIPALVAMISAAAPVIVIVLAIAAAAYLLYEAWTNNFLGIRTGIEAFLAWIQPIWEAVWNAVLVVFNFVWAQIKTIWEAWSAAFNGDWETFGAKMREGWDRTWAFIKTIFSAAGRALLQMVVTFIQGIVNAFLNTNWAAVGQNILKGLVQGAVSLTSWAVNQMIAIAQAMAAAFRGFFGIHSPSTLMAAYGMNMAQGVISGFDSTLQKTPLTATFAEGALKTELDRRGSTGLGGGLRSPTEGNYNITVNNPVPERTPDSIRRELKKLSFIGVPD